MATCGYLCPSCEGKGFTDSGEPCEWCEMPSPVNEVKPEELENDQWIEAVHGKCSCSDIGEK